MTIDRAEARNAVNRAVSQQLADALRRFADDDALSVGVITGAGGTFSAGMDLKAFPTEGIPLIGDQGFCGLTRAHPEKPLIAAVEGWALGGGFELALACDLIVCGRSALFALSEVTRGLIPAEGGALRLPQCLPYHVAMEALLTGEPLTAATAERFGLVNRVVADGESLSAALELAHRIARNAPLALAAIKRVQQVCGGRSDAAAFAAQDEIAAPVNASKDAEEGARAFAEKRPPVWRRR
ncbi:crotonase/enoyl-CoA hydratase family protein [Streptomyces sp. AV19]|nr:crotonase/enoyl-CoA hydratase family protein [Streptomyces sp. AV19]MBH1938028.1 crotonase/enoyl-CoA hydratase family protein [Streptomyces sp. AV19]MDG4536642.1 crotonase/enoyl-CoA hydratase family protein [Streptomyces sp. AV19]